MLYILIIQLTVNLLWLCLNWGKKIPASKVHDSYKESCGRRKLNETKAYCLSSDCSLNFGGRPPSLRLFCANLSHMYNKKFFINFHAFIREKERDI